MRVNGTGINVGTVLRSHQPDGRDQMVIKAQIIHFPSRSLIPLGHGSTHLRICRLIIRNKV